MNWQMTNEKGNAKESSKVSPYDGKQLIVKKKGPSMIQKHKMLGLLQGTNVQNVPGTRHCVEHPCCDKYT